MKRKVLNVIRTLLSLMGDEKMDDESKVDYSDPSSVENYLEHNLREGYLSEDEQKFVDNLVSELESSLEKSDVQQVVREVQLNKVD